MEKEKAKTEVKEQLNFVTKLLRGDSKESSKRFLAVYIVIILGTVITIVGLWKEVDIIYLLATWLTFAASLLGMSEYNKNKALKLDADIKKEEIKNNPVPLVPKKGTTDIEGAVKTVPDVSKNNSEPKIANDSEIN